MCYVFVFIQTGVWSRCSLGLKKREVSCVDENGRQQAEEECVLQTNRPRSEAECRLSVSDCVVGPLSWTNCTPCQSGKRSFDITEDVARFLDHDSFFKSFDKVLKFLKMYRLRLVQRSKASSEALAFFMMNEKK